MSTPDGRRTPSPARDGNTQMFRRVPARANGHTQDLAARMAGTKARPVFVALRPPGGPDAGAPGTGERSVVANSPFNGGWRWWLQLCCGVAAIVEGCSLLLIGLGLWGLL